MVEAAPNAIEIQNDKNFTLTLTGAELAHIMQPLKLVPAPYDQTTNLLQKIGNQIVEQLKKDE